MFLNQLKMNKFWASSGGPYPLNPWFKSRVAHGLGKPEACFETLGFTRKPQVFQKSTAFLTRVDHGLHAGFRRSEILTQTFRSWMLSNSRHSKHSSFNPKISLNIGCVGFIVWSRVNPGFYFTLKGSSSPTLQVGKINTRLSPQTRGCPCCWPKNGPLGGDITINWP